MGNQLGVSLHSKGWKSSGNAGNFIKEKNKDAPDYCSPSLQPEGKLLHLLTVEMVAYIRNARRTFEITFQVGIRILKQLN